MWIKQRRCDFADAAGGGKSNSKKRGRGNAYDDETFPCQPVKMMARNDYNQSDQSGPRQAPDGPPGKPPKQRWGVQGDSPLRLQQFFAPKVTKGDERQPGGCDENLSVETRYEGRQACPCIDEG